MEPPKAKKQKRTKEGALPPSVTNGPLASSLQGEVSTKFVETFVRRVGLSDLAYSTKVQDKLLLLDNPLQPKTRKSKPKGHKVERLLSQKLSYESFQGLHQLWVQYMDDVLSTGGMKVEAKLLLADFHGAIACVCQSKCPSYVGLCGMVLQETHNAFVVVSKDDSVKLIPKQNNVFTIRLGSSQHEAKLYGNHFISRSYMRTVKRFKMQKTIEL